MIIQILIEIQFNMAHITTGFISSLIVFILIMQGNVSRTIPEGAVKVNTEFECHTDNDCFEKNTYCDISLNLCSQCLNCSMYFRTFKINIKCPKDISDCSNCMDGYSEEVFFGGEIRDLCVPIDSNIILPTPAKITSNYIWQDFGIILIIVCNVFIILLFWTYFYKKVWNINSNVSNVLQDNIENPPPSYHSCMKLDNYVTDDVQEFHLFTGEQPPRNEWRHQNAVPFRLPDNFLQRNNNINDENENNEETDGAVMTEVDLELHDEETMPSTWTPFSESETSINLEINNTLSTSSPPFKRIRLVQQFTDEINYQDEDNEDNTSDISQDD